MMVQKVYKVFLSSENRFIFIIISLFLWEECLKTLEVGNLIEEGEKGDGKCYCLRKNCLMRYEDRYHCEDTKGFHLVVEHECLIFEVQSEVTDLHFKIE
jgi:hypothetical protein